jgi:ketosteroid isomerase-like protein
MNPMRKPGILLSVLVLITAMATISVRAGEEEPPRTQVNDSTAVMAVMAQFHTALEALFEGDAGPMEQVWSHRDDVAYMGPTGASVLGWKNLSAFFKTQAALQLGGEIKSKRKMAVLGSKLAIVYADEVGYHQIDEGQREDILIRATNVFRKEDGQWKMIGHHTDIVPSLKK